MKTKLMLMGLLLTMATQFGYAKNYYGVVVGCCKEYEDNNIPALHGKDDAISFYNILVNMYYQGSQAKAQNKLHLLTERKATRANIKDALTEVANNAQPGDVVYFFYSGHGSSLEDKSRLIKVSYQNNALMKAMENSGLIVPYNFRFKDVLNTAVIGSRDLRDNGGRGFKYLDKQGVQVIMISDSCFAGNIYRTGNQTTGKYIPISERINALTAHSSKPKERSFYNNLIFFSAGGTDKVVTENDRLKRRKFTLALEKCLKTANQNSDNKITKKELEECLRTEDTARAFVRYPTNRLANRTVFRAMSKNISTIQKDKIRVKTSIRGLEHLSNEIVIDNQNYDIEIIKSGNRYKIFRYTGEEYANVNEANLSAYLNAFKLFKLKGKAKLKVEVLNGKRREQGQFCYGEKVSVEIKEPIKGHIVALTLNNQGGVVMIQPNDSKISSSKLIDMAVQAPEGMDKVKVFMLSNEHQYNQVKKLVIKGGELVEYSINKLYKILKSNKNYKEAEVDIETIDKPLNYCRQGD